MTTNTPTGDAVRVFISYSHDNSEHEERALALADRLREFGLDAVIDQYEADPPEGWPRWMVRQAREARFILMICTKTYFNRCEGLENEGKGQGVKWEGHLLYNLLYTDDTLNRKAVPVLFPNSTPKHVPPPFQGFTHYRIDPSNLTVEESGFEGLYRQLTNQPKTVKPVVGHRKALPPRAAPPSSPAQPPANAPESTEVRFETIVSGGNVGTIVNVAKIETLVMHGTSGPLPEPSLASDSDIEPRNP